MTIGSMFTDIVGSLFKKPATERYPFERNLNPERLRGKLVYDPSNCSGCQLCVKDCPADALELFVIDKAAKKFVLLYSIERCTFCGQCAESCRFKCLDMSSEMWELAALNKDHFTVYYGKPEDIQIVLARSTAQSDSDV